MLVNWNTKIEGSGVILIPYCRHHVEKYHQWMKDPELQHLTGSEPLTLDEEYQMQETWRDSCDKCTFIVLKRDELKGQNDEINSMIGDTNIFLTTDEDLGTNVGEIEIMIADPSARGKRLGWEAVCLMLAYGAEELKIEQFEAKIKLDNEKSISMFKKLQFVESQVSHVFQEVTLTVKITDSWRTFINEQIPTMKKSVYNHPVEI